MFHQVGLSKGSKRHRIQINRELNLPLNTFSNTIWRGKMTKVSWIYFQIGRPAQTCVAASVSAKILRV